MVRLREEQKIELIKQERERRRIARLKQVRQQSATHAKIIREVVNHKKREIIEDVRAELHAEINAIVDEVSENAQSIVAKSAQILPKRRNSSSPPAKRRPSTRNRPLTELDIQLAKKRNEAALKKLKDTKKREKLEKQSKLAKKKEAERLANKILKQGTSSNSQ